MPGYPINTGRRESLSDHLRDLAGQFSNMANVLGDQYANLDAATYGLLDGTFPWTGQGATAFGQSWQIFGQYIQQLQQGCADAAKSLNKFAQKMDDVEAQQAWDILLTIVGGLLTIISFAAAIAEFGLDPFVDGFTAFIAGFTEQEGADVVNVAEDITQADTEAAGELQQIEEDLTTIPTLSGSGVSAPGDLPGAVSPANLDEMMVALDDELGSEGQQLLENELGPGSDGDGVFPPDLRIPYEPTEPFYQQMQPGSCVAASSRMVLADFGIDMPEAYVRDIMGVDAVDGGTIKNIPQGLQELGLNNPPYVYQENLTINDLAAATEDGPAVVSLKVPGGGFHAAVVDSIQNGIVYIRDPLGSSYGVSIQDFLNLWNQGKAVIPGT